MKEGVLGRTFTAPSAVSARRNGSGAGLTAALALPHLIPPDRLTEGYQKGLAEGIYFSAVVLAHLRASADELAGYRIRWHEPIGAMLKRDPHRAIQLATIRGRRKGLAFVRSLG